MEDEAGWGLDMRNIYVGVALAVVFAGALFAASYFWPHRSETSPPPATPDQVAAAVRHLIGAQAVAVDPRDSGSIGLGQVGSADEKRKGPSENEAS